MMVVTHVISTHLMLRKQSRKGKINAYNIIAAQSSISFQTNSLVQCVHVEIFVI